MMDKVLVRCLKCDSINRVLHSKISQKTVCGNCKKELAFISAPVDVTASAFQKEVIKWPGVVLVDFWSITCGHCMKLNPILEEIAYAFRGVVKVVKVNAQTEQHLAMQFDIRSVPTLILYRYGVRLETTAGAMNKKQLEGWIKGITGI